MIKQYIKTKIFNFVNRIATDVADAKSREVAQEVTISIVNDINHKIDNLNFDIKEKLSQLMGISFELIKKLNAVNSHDDAIDIWDKYQDKQFGFWIGDFYKEIKNKSPIDELFCSGLNCILGNRPIKITPNGNTLDEIDILALWGQSSQIDYIPLLYNALLKQKKIVFIEDGFFYNIISHTKSLTGNYPLEFTQAMSFTIDDITAHFDASLPSKLEQMIVSDYQIDYDELIRASSLIQTIIENKITKYNYQSLKNKIYGSKESKILVVDQAYGDYSVYKSGVSEEVFKRMLKDAIAENPEADILVKVHPDMIVNPNRAGAKNGGYFWNMKIEHQNVILISEEINPYVIIKQVQKVYVCTSQLGFESLMAGKEVYTYGVPFYAGWGLTIDRGNSEYLNRRRGKHRTVEEIFWFSYIWYSRYYSPARRVKCELEDVLETLQKFRIQYQIETKV